MMSECHSSSLKCELTLALEGQDSLEDKLFFTLIFKKSLTAIKII